MAMSVRIGTGLSTARDAREAALEAGAAARAGLGGEPCDLAIVFASGTHLIAPEALLEAVHEALAPEALVGCGAGGVIGPHREIEEGTAVSIWAAHLGGGTATAFHAAVEELEEGAGALTGMPDLAGAAGAILLADPATFPTDAVLRFLSDAAPMVSLLGGLASGRTGDGAVLMMGEDVLDEGAVGVRLDGVEVLPCVSQGATPIGPELTITSADGNIIDELAGRPALETLRETIESAARRGARAGAGRAADGHRRRRQQARLRAGRLPRARPGRRRPGHRQGGGRRRRAPRARSCACTRATPTAPTATCARRSEIRMTALGGRAPAGALLFSCNGRGRDMFSAPHHDADAVAEALLGAPAAGFFAAGEIGPVGGEHFLHSFTATVAVFA